MDRRVMLTQDDYLWMSGGALYCLAATVVFLGAGTINGNGLAQLILLLLAWVEVGFGIIILLAPAHDLKTRYAVGLEKELEKIPTKFKLSGKAPWWWTAINTWYDIMMIFCLFMLGQWWLAAIYGPTVWCAKRANRAAMRAAVVEMLKKPQVEIDHERT